MHKLLIFVIILFISCGDQATTSITSVNSAPSTSDTIQSNSSGKLFSDKSRLALLTSQAAIKFAFQKDFEMDTLNDDDLQLIEEKLLLSIDSFNVAGRKLMDKRMQELGPAVKMDLNYFIIDPSRYKFQIVAIINDKKQREVWVNAFCKDDEINWHTEIIKIKGGGTCYFNSRINLLNQEMSYFKVNTNEE